MTCFNLFQAQEVNFKDFSAFKNLSGALDFSGNYSIVTCDAVLMYIDSRTEQCITRLFADLLDPATSKQFPRYSPKVLVAALKIITNNNQMNFRDMFVKQLQGITMGMLPVSTIANLFVSLHKQKVILILPKVASKCHLYRRFIDDGFAIWNHNKDQATDMQN